eukprot:SAG31_NODE_1008_length_10407_cov_2.369131_9_plen_241_part_00
MTIGWLCTALANAHFCCLRCLVQPCHLAPYACAAARRGKICTQCCQRRTCQQRRPSEALHRELSSMKIEGSSKFYSTYRNKTAIVFRQTESASCGRPAAQDDRDLLVIINVARRRCSELTFDISNLNTNKACTAQLTPPWMTTSATTDTNIPGRKTQRLTPPINLRAIDQRRTTLFSLSAAVLRSIMMLQSCTSLFSPTLTVLRNPAARHKVVQSKPDMAKQFSRIRSLLQKPSTSLVSG